VRRPAPAGFFLGALTSVLALAVLKLGAAAGSHPYVPFDLFEQLVRVLPGTIVTAGIDAMVSLIGALGIHPTATAAKLAEQGAAIGLFVAGCAVLGAVVGALSRGRPRRALAYGVAAGAVWLVVELAVAPNARTAGGIVWLAVVLLGWGAALGGLLGAREVIVAAHPDGPARRTFLLASVGGIAMLSGVLFVIAQRLRASPSAAARTPRLLDLSGTSGPAASPPASTLAQRIAPAQGTRPELTPTASFYRIDINLEPPRIREADWRLAIGGLVDQPLALTLAELRAMPSVSQVATLECISNPVGGDLIGTCLWTGVRLSDVLARAKLRPEARAIHLRAADGFYESVSAADLADPRTLLVYAMNREPLTDVHGFPLRIYIPNRHGMKLPKWIIQLHASDRDGPGYWVDRGWSATAIPHTTSVIDTATAASIGGIAYAGARGISRVEIQLDDGPWHEARLVAPPLGPLCWVLWRYDGSNVAGAREVRVRAYDGSGAPQDTRVQPPHPAGATGLHTRRYGPA
jgi:DMSO/TMAO reductase YedYZ molybdopterin-dependent catalytic subunit